MIKTKNLRMDTSQQDDILARNLKYLMNKNTIDAGTLGRNIDVAASTINGIRRGGGNPTLGTVAAIAQHFQLSISDLTEKYIDGDAIPVKSAHRISLITMKDIPIYLKNPKRTERIMITELGDTNSENFFAVSIDNNSLYPLFEKGTVFIVKKTKQVLDGDIVLVDFGNASYCFRRIFVESSNYFFKPLIDTLQSPGSHTKQFTLVGIVVKAIQNFE